MENEGKQGTEGGEGIDFLSEIGASASEVKVGTGLETKEGDTKEGDTEAKEGEGIKKSAEGEGEGDKGGESEPEPTKAVVDEKDKIITELRAQLAELAGRETKEPEKAPELDPAKQAALSLQDVEDFVVSDEDFDKAFENKEHFNTVLKKVVAKTIEKVLRNVPMVIDNVVKQQTGLYMKSAEFFNKNKDLRSYAQFVGSVANDIAGKSPNITLDELFGDDEKPGKLADEVRSRLALKKNAEKKEEVKERERPAFVKQGVGARVPSKQVNDLSSLEESINDLIT